jgi:nucleotide-binding universal stress UspA family protein
MPADGPILIAYDGSDHAKGAIATVGEQLRPGRRAIVATVFEALDQIPFIGAGGLPVEAETVEQLRGSAEQAALSTAEEGSALARQAGFEAEPLATEGAPVWERIVAAADERDCDLIVIGSRGLSGVKHVLLGSVAAAVAQHSKRSILIVHDR